LETIFSTVLLTLIVSALILLLLVNMATAEKRLEHCPKHLYGSGDPGFRRALGVLLGPPIVSGNHVETLINGDRIFPAMLKAIDDAQVSICFETFIFRDDIAAKFCQALSAAAQRGVKVHMLLDWVGARRMDEEKLQNVARAGAQVELYHELTWFHLGRLNNRTHRKLLIIDGQIGFTGGVGVGTEWTGDGEDPPHWRDNHYRVQGPVVAQMQAVFIDNWTKATGEVLHGDDYFPELEPAGEMDAQMFGSSPAGGSASMHLMVLLAIAAAERSIDITNSYFVPDDLAVGALLDARKRGVRVRILVPGRHTDAPLGRYAAHALCGVLLEAGVEMYEYEPTMIHTKIIIVDELWVSVGSSNFDDRSFRLNDEANLNVFSPELAREQIEQMEKDIGKAHRLSLRRWVKRPTTRRLYENVAMLLRSQL
jgi:cardiolipin synthase A/B